MSDEIMVGVNTLTPFDKEGQEAIDFNKKIQAARALDLYHARRIVAEHESKGKPMPRPWSPRPHRCGVWSREIF